MDDKNSPSGNDDSTSDDENFQEALRSTRWFAYIAVGITLAAMVLGMAVMIRVVYLFLRGFM